MFDFTAISTEVVAVIQTSLTLIDPTTFIGGVVTLAIVSTIMVSVVRKLRSLAR